MNFHPRSFAFLNSLVLKSFSSLSTRQRSAQLSPTVMLQPLSTSLQGGLRFVCPLCPAFPDALRLRFYPCYLHEILGRKRRASTFHISDKYVGLGSSCLPAGRRLRISCVKRLYLASLPFWYRAYHSLFRSLRLTAVTVCSSILAIPTNPCPESVLRPRRLSTSRFLAPL